MSLRASRLVVPDAVEQVVNTEDENEDGDSDLRMPERAPLTPRPLRVEEMLAGDELPSRPMRYAIRPATWGVAWA